MKTLIVYHSADWDGYVSGAIALMANQGAQLFGWTYNRPAPRTDGYEKIILVDLTIQERGSYSWMYDNADRLVWIDHHMDAVQQVESGIQQAGIKKIDGLRKEGIGACVLTWEYFFGGEVPPHVALCGTYDVFRKDGAYADWNDAWAYQLALNNITKWESGVDNSLNNIKLAIQFINENSEETLKRIEFGKTLETKRYEDEVVRFQKAKFGEINGVKICTLIDDGQPAVLMKSNMDNHTADVFFLRSAKPSPDGKYRVSIRVPEKSNIDANMIAKKYNGGGHKKAAGCRMSEEEFNNLLMGGINESKQKKTIKITKSDLRQIIKESVKLILNKTK
jgi:oligoribonuclease NrnB/cAMP/cGMP phosphodiesterase (DHH superfamily)